MLRLMPKVPQNPVVWLVIPKDLGYFFEKQHFSKQESVITKFLENTSEIIPNFPVNNATNLK